MKLRKQFKIRVVYKSGYTHDFWVREFNIKGTSYSWDSVSETNKPLLLGIDDVAAVWVLGSRYRFA